MIDNGAFVDVDCFTQNESQTNRLKFVIPYAEHPI
jgi:hypothetical protein